MKIKVFIIGFFTGTVFGIGGNSDSLVYDLGNHQVYLRGDKYIIQTNSGKVLYDNLKYFGNALQYWQVLDEKNQLFYLNQNIEKSEITDNFLGVCGTVPNYSLWIEEEEYDFIVMKDETFYDSGNQIPAEEYIRISKSKVDEICFINGKTKFSYDGNYGIGSVVTSPELIIYKKNEKYGIWQDETKTLYDQILFENLNLKLILNQKEGYYGLTAVKYQKIQPFIYNLAQFITPTGKTGYVDINGNEYYDD